VNIERQKKAIFFHESVNMYRFFQSLKVNPGLVEGKLCGGVGYSLPVGAICAIVTGASSGL
jgi:hypothetical protein